ncbi:MAG: AAA family ATPase, partial [Bacteroidetes bacterium]
MSLYIARHLESKLLESVARYPAVVITGPRQVGKTSLVKAILPQLGRPALYLDLEYPEDQNKLSNPAFFLESVQDHVVVIDEVQRMPSLFPVLRSVIDRFRQPGRFILLGSASPEIIRDSSESLAGRVTYLELMPLSAKELEGKKGYQDLWLQGGFPESILAPDKAFSLDWRLNFIQTYLERDLPLLGLKADPQLVRRLWPM